MQLVSKNILVDSHKPTSKYPPVYPQLKEFGLWNPNAWKNGQPHDFYSRMRSEAPVMWSDAGKKYAGFWSISRYEDVKAIEVQPEIFSSERGSINMLVLPSEDSSHEKLMMAALNTLINLDEPRHMQMRIQQKDFFVPQYVSEVSEKVEKEIDRLLDEVERAGPVVDFVKLFSNNLPLFTLCEMLGVEEADRPRIVQWMHYLEMASQFTLNPWQTFLSEPSFPFKFNKNVTAMFQYGQDVMADRRARPRHDLLSLIANTELDGEKLPQEFLDGSWLLIIFAGNDTSRNSITGALRLLTQFPDQKQMVLDDLSLVPQMVEESIRLTSPVIHMRRTALHDTQFRGQQIAEDEKVVLWYGAANRDPDVFPDPNRMDITRDNVTKHLAFGHGPHKCLGSRIAQMQLRLSLTKILERFPKITWTGKQKLLRNNFVNAISSLEVNLYGPDGERPTQMQVRK